MKKIQIKHLNKEGELNTLFEASNTDANKVRYVSEYNHLIASLDSGCIFGFEGDDIILFHNFDAEKLGGVLIKTSLINT